MKLFPTLEGQPYGYANLNEYSKDWSARMYRGRSGPNPLLDPQECGRMVEKLHASLGLIYSYGGWMEDRSTLWHGSYLDERKTHLHLADDFNVPAGTPVAATREGVILRIDNDYPEIHGWGARIIVRLSDEPVLLIYAHLNPLIRRRKGDRLHPGDLLATVGEPKHNGGWFPHLHVQAVTREAFERYVSDLSTLDGYGAQEDISRLAREFPDPLRFLQL